VTTPASDGRQSNVFDRVPLGLIVIVCRHHPDRPLMQYIAAPRQDGTWGGSATISREHMRLWGGSQPHNVERDLSSGHLRWRMECTSCRAKPVLRDSTLLGWARKTYEANLIRDTPTVPRFPA
jgi:hypothetical protein